MHALFECLEDVIEITKKHTKAVSGEFCLISLFLHKLILGFDILELTSEISLSFQII